MPNGKDNSPSVLQYRKLLVILFLALALSFVVTLDFGRSLRQTHYQYGDIARDSVRAPSDTYVPKLDITIKKGEIIVREGERITGEHLARLSALYALHPPEILDLRKFGSLFLLLFLLIVILYEYADRNIKKFGLTRKDFLFSGVLMLFATFVVRLCIFLFEYLVQAPAGSLFYVMPVFVFGIVLRIVLFSEAAMIFSAIFSIVMALTLGSSIQIFLYTFLGNILGAYFSGRCENRNTILRAGLYTSFVMSFFTLLSDVFFGQPLGNIPFRICFILISGVGSGFIALGLLPVIEQLFDYTTDIKLLELANFEHPLIEEMMLNTPGTYHHSILVGNLSKAAAESIGAHPLLTRVASYYHDIGKLKMPHYFIENRKGVTDVHQALSPSMSALIILSHVKEGVALAEQYHLGRKITDIIRQHHGTSLVSYFFNRAKEIEDPTLYVTEEKDFRYGGPRPQTKEAGIIMLADAVEAASRVLDDPTPKRIENLVQNVIEHIFLDGQLDECELTLKDLHAIQKSIITMLIGIFHQRIEYPERTVHDGTNKRLPKNPSSGQESTSKNNRKLTHLFRVAG
jgi:cyclic-di-AMP phosphodiesterase PgpH